MGDINYASEKFGSAVRILATSRDAIHERVKAARIEFGPVTEEDLPPDAIEDFQAFKSRFQALETEMAHVVEALEDQIRAGHEQDTDLAANAINKWYPLAGLICDIDCAITHAIFHALEHGEPRGPRRA